MPGSIQSIERAAAILRILAAAPVPLRLAEVSASLQLPKGTAHGILRTLTEVGLVEQDRVTGRYRPGAGPAEPGSGYLDPNELRARSLNWADPLAARTGEAARVGVLTGAEVLVVHYVFRPDSSEQHADVGELLPAHATALGKVLLAHHAATTALLAADDVLTSYTARTIDHRGKLIDELTQIRTQGHAVEFGEYLPDQAALAAPIFGYGGLVVGAVAVHGDLDRLCDPAGAARPRMLALVLDCARAISRELKTSRAEELNRGVNKS